MNVLCILNAPEGGATQGILELLPHLPEDVRFELVVPSAPRPGFPAAAHVVPMGSWNRSRDLPSWYRALAWGAATKRSLWHVRPVTAIRRLIRESSIDVVYTGTAMNIEGALAARLEGVPHVWHLKEWIGNRGRTRFPLPDPVLMRVIDGLATRVVAMSDFIAGPMRAHGVTVDVIPDGVNLAAFDDASPEPVRSELGIGPDEILVAQCASFRSTWKRHELFLAAAEESLRVMPELRFVGFGSVPATSEGPYGTAGRAFDTLRSRAAASEPAVQLGRFCPDIPAMMNAIDVLVHTCEIEPFGRVAIEAMAAGKPVVGPSTGGISETVAHEETGLLVRPRDARAYASAIVGLAGDPERRKQYGKAGRARVDQHYTIEAHRDSLLTVLRGAAR